MKQKNKIQFRLKIINKDEKVVRYHSHKLRRIYAILQGANFKVAYLRVCYGGGSNDGEYYKKDALLRALSAFAEKSLIDELGGNDD